jgi:pimeloyl-ACP methyl ester carboxylesterase
MLGQSMGTYAGQEMTFEHPDRVLALIVIGGTCITPILGGSAVSR